MVHNLEHFKHNLPADIPVPLGFYPPQTPMGEILYVLHTNSAWTKVILEHPTACTAAMDDTYSVIWDSGASLCINNNKYDFVGIISIVNNCLNFMGYNFHPSCKCKYHYNTIQFCIGCLNARVNGTIFFGVGGKKTIKNDVEKLTSI